MIKRYMTEATPGEEEHSFQKRFTTEAMTAFEVTRQELRDAGARGKPVKMVTSPFVIMSERTNQVCSRGMTAEWYMDAQALSAEVVQRVIGLPK